MQPWALKQRQGWQTSRGTKCIGEEPRCAAPKSCPIAPSDHTTQRLLDLNPCASILVLSHFNLETFPICPQLRCMNQSVNVAQSCILACARWLSDRWTSVGYSEAGTTLRVCCCCWILYKRLATSVCFSAIMGFVAPTPNHVYYCLKNHNAFQCIRYCVLAHKDNFTPVGGGMLAIAVPPI